MQASSIANELGHLGLPSLGWESWYNHYANITQKQIINDLNSLSEKPNFVTLSEMNLSRPNHSQSVFQIDDGWEMQLGNWEYDKNKFPDGLQFVTNQIEKKGFIPIEDDLHPDNLKLQNIFNRNSDFEIVLPPIEIIGGLYDVANFDAILKWFENLCDIIS